MLRTLVFLGLALSAALIEPANGADRDDYCRPEGTPGRFCFELFDELDPWEPLQVETRSGPVINGRASNLFHVRDLSTEQRVSYKPIGRISIKFRHRSNANDEWVAWCTGSLIDNDVVLTAYHCLPGGLTSSYVPVAAKIVFNYLAAGSDSAVGWHSILSDPAGCAEHDLPVGSLCPIAKNADKNSDFVLLRVATDSSGMSAGDKFGTLQLSQKPLTQGELITVPQHPASRPQAIGFGPARFINVGDSEFTHGSSTYNMSSGSPVLSMRDGSLLGMHRRGGECSEAFAPTLGATAGCANVAVALTSMSSNSPLIRALTASFVSTQPQITVDGQREESGPIDFESIVNSAVSGDPVAQWQAGLLYEYALSPEDLALRGLSDVSGRPMLQSYDEARKWYEQAAAAGVVEAATDLAALDFYGIGGARDEAGAIEVFKKSAAAGDTFADGWLGILYLAGSASLARDQQKAFMHLRQAAAAGNIYASRAMELNTLSDGQRNP